MPAANATPRTTPIRPKPVFDDNAPSSDLLEVVVDVCPGSETPHQRSMDQDDQPDSDPANATRTMLQFLLKEQKHNHNMVKQPSASMKPAERLKKLKFREREGLLNRIVWIERIAASGLMVMCLANEADGDSIFATVLPNDISSCDATGMSRYDDHNEGLHLVLKTLIKYCVSQGAREEGDGSMMLALSIRSTVELLADERRSFDDCEALPELESWRQPSIGYFTCSSRNTQA